MTQALAIFLDAYRELNARKMFWITLILSGLALCVLLLVGISADHKFRIAFWETPIPIPPMIDLAWMLKSTFVSFGIGFWITWAAAILALISTASIFPDFLSGGSIDLVLAKPIGRWRLFLLKYLSGLLFVGLQAAVFSLVGFLIIGLRAGAWEPGLFLTIPLVMAFFSYLFCVCVLVGVATRSTIAALLTTLLFWLLVFVANLTDEYIMMPRVMNEVYVEKLEQRLTSARTLDQPDEQRIAQYEVQLTEARTDLVFWTKWHRLVVGLKTVLPKTAETVKLLERTLVKMADLPETEGDDEGQRLPFLSPKMASAGVRVKDVAERIEKTYRSRSAWWVLGTSLGFEFVVLFLAGWIFRRRDF